MDRIMDYPDNYPDIHWISKTKKFRNSHCPPSNLYHLPVNKLAVTSLDCLPAYYGCGGSAQVKISLTLYPCKADALADSRPQPQGLDIDFTLRRRTGSIGESPIYISGDSR